MNKKISFECAYCSQYMEAPPEALGRRVQCYKCEEKFELTLLHKVEPRKEEAPKLKLDPQKVIRPKRKKRKLISMPVVLMLILGTAGCLFIENQEGSQSQAKETVSVKKTDDADEKTLTVDSVEIQNIITFDPEVFELKDISEKEQTIEDLELALKELPTKSGFLGEVQKSCYRCHGKLRKGKPRIEGDFDLTALLTKNKISIDDSSTWLKVLNEVKSKRMPPEDEKEELSDLSRKKWQRYLTINFAKKNLLPRMLTAAEINNDHSLVYGYNRDFYDPFETLKLQKVSDARYPTIQSAELMSRSFLESLQYGLEELVQDYTLSPHSVNRSHTLKPEETSQASIRVGVTTSADSLDGIEKGSKHFEFKTWGRQRLYFKSHPGFGTPAGHYRITFKANALDRAKISELKKKYESDKKGQRYLKGLLDVWQELLYSKARVSLINSGNRTRQATDNGLFHTFEIQDEKEQIYSCDFTLKTATLLDLSFDNGPYNGRKHWVRLGNERQVKGEKYSFPRVEIRDVQITKIAELEDKNPYDICVIKESGLSAQSVLQKLKSYAANLGLKGKGNYIEKLYADMPSTLTLREKYKTVLKLVSMFSEYLYIDFKKGKDHAARYMSYSLLK